MTSRTLGVTGTLLSLLLWAGCSASTTSRDITVLLSPTSAEVETLKTLQFKATVSGNANDAVTWSVVEGTHGGVINVDGLYTAPENPGEFTVLATSVADKTKTASAKVTVIPVSGEVGISISPSETLMAVNTTRTFSAIVTGARDAQVAWSVQEGGGGWVTASGAYTAPEVPGTFHVIATSVADPAKTARATVTVVQPPKISVSVTPSSRFVKPTETFQFRARLTNTEVTDVHWSVEEGADGGTISSDGLYTAPETKGVYHVVAKSVEDPTAIGSATVTVTDEEQVAVTITPFTATVQTGKRHDFDVKVTGNGTRTSAVTWSVLEEDGGTVSSTGQYQAPWKTGVFHVVATSNADPSQSDMVPVTVIPSTPALTLSPSGEVVIAAGAQMRFIARVTDAENTAVRWTLLQGGAAGRIDPDGLYTAPNTFGTYNLEVRSVAHPNLVQTATIKVVRSGPFAVAGNVEYTGTKTGRVYVGVFDGSNNPIAGTTIASPGPFNLRGVRGVGEHKLYAFMDHLGGALPVEVDPRGTTEFLLEGADITGLKVTLTDPAPPDKPAEPPSGLQAIRGDGGVALVYWNSTTSADSYRVYWSRTKDPGPANTEGVRTVRIGTNLVAGKYWAFVTGLDPNASYYFGVAAVFEGSEGTVRDRSTAEAMPAPTTGTPVPVTVNFPGETGTLYVVVFADTSTGAPQGVARVSAATHPQSVTVPYVPDGKSRIFAFLDVNDDGEAGPMDPANWRTLRDSKVTVDAATVRTTLTLPTGASVKRGTTHTFEDASGGQTFSAVISVEGARKIPASATLSGPALEMPWDLGFSTSYGKLFEADIFLGPIKVEGNFRLDVSYTDGTSESMTITPKYVDGFATPVSPIGTSTRTPTFTWTAPSPAPASYTQQILVYLAAENLRWASPVYPASTLTTAYDGSTLPLDSEVTWFVVVTDASGNTSRRGATFKTPKP